MASHGSFYAKGCLTLFIAGMGGCAASSQHAVPKPLDRLQTAYDQGRLEFQTELAQGRPTVEIYGDEGATPGFDEETGLPQVVVPKDDMNPTLAGRVSGHNDALREYIEQSGLPAASRKKWEGEILHPGRYFNDQMRGESPLRLATDAPRVASPDGRFILLLRETTPDTRPAAATPPQLILFTPMAQQAVPLPTTLSEQRDVSFFWGPSGSDTAVFRLAPPDGAGGPVFSTLDLRTGQWLHTEPPISGSDALSRSAG